MTYMKRYGVVMAGGGGTRFWPLSRQKMPKQLLNLTGRDLMVNETIDRLSGTVDKDNIFIVTNKDQVATMKEATVERIQPNHILSEPAARNTAACIGYAALENVKKYGDGIMVITPSDAYIKNTEAFTEVLKTAVQVAEETDKLITVGITPTFPSTGYGYIKYDKNEAGVAKEVQEFKEKPDLATAKSYLASGNYVWNSGMFIWKASVILKNFERFIPRVYRELEKIGEAMGTDKEYDVINEVYPNIRSISIDYGIMEQSEDVLVVPGEFGWSDVGSWDMLGVLHEADEDGNIIVGDKITINSSDIVGYSSGRLIAAVDVSHLVIVETDDVVLVCDKSKAQNVKLVVEELKKQGRNELL